MIRDANLTVQQASKEIVQDLNGTMNIGVNLVDSGAHSFICKGEAWLCDFGQAQLFFRFPPQVCNGSIAIPRRDNL